ncbi:MAG: hypothetical protein R2847_10145 [Bacteroidia bacterium]
MILPIELLSRMLDWAKGECGAQLPGKNHAQISFLLKESYTQITINLFHPGPNIKSSPLGTWCFICNDDVYAEMLEDKPCVPKVNGVEYPSE